MGSVYEAIAPHGELLRRQALVHGERTCIIVDDETLTYNELLRRATALAKGMYAQGIRRGDRIGVWMPNCTEFFVVHFAIQLLGAITVTINARYKSYELQYAVKHSDIRLLFTTDRIDEHVNFGDLLWQTYPSLSAGRRQGRLHLEDAPYLENVVLVGSSERAPFVPLAEFAATGSLVAESDLEQCAAPVTIDDISVMLFTSGTTAAPKACQLTHRGIYQTWVHTYPEAVKLQPGEKVWVPMPCFHVGGIGLTATAVSQGAAFATSIYHQAAAALRLIRDHQIEHLYPGFFTLILPVLREPDYSKAAFAKVRSMVAVAPFETHKLMQEYLPEGILTLQLFGMSEASGYVSFTPSSSDEEHRLRTNGKPIAGVDVRIVDDSGQIVPAGGQGEIQFRGPNSFHSYYKDAAATDSTIVDGGWVRTGDCGSVDAEGYVYFLGRIKDMLKVGGENVAAAEIEAYLGRHPAVKMSQVVGKPDEYYGEVAVAFVELMPGKEVDAAELIAFCKGRLASFKVPREVRFVTEWPMSATKIQKFKLRELLKTGGA
ncbi:class I adenylate-forming enzyme family protein [Steroidobacter sp.]|uniref:class I adenylate-forming enzyme family protein n=1 Tax=Steroidobacter sp. TaxID=1978227 RepID=UPI001A5AB4A6|nr:class I adenylate-forming enzyme family protein [Steroidobacter sp.]MBL8267024.1 acyl--CoA ligase [Steroidobacter sp.]